MAENETNTVIPDLVHLLESQREEINTEIIRSFDRFTPNSVLARLPMCERRSWTDYEINRLIQILKQGHPGPDQPPVYATAKNMLDRGWEFSDVIENHFYVNKDAITPFIWREFSSDPPKLQAALLNFDLCLLKYIGFITRDYADEISRRLLEKREHLAQMEERYRLAREIHDNLSQALGLIILKTSQALELYDANQFENIRPCLAELKDIALGAFAESREALLGLRTDITETTDFIPLLNNFLTRYERFFGINFLCTFDENLSNLPINVTTQLFCIIQEALANIRKHAYTKNVRLSIHYEDDGVSTMIEDSGKGFDLASLDPQNQQGVGLQVMRERAESIGGALTIKTHVGEGTQIKIWIPQSALEEAQ